MLDDDAIRGHLPMQSSAARLFEVMGHMRKTWQAFQPVGSMNKSCLGLLSMMSQMEKQGHTLFSITELAAMVQHSVPAVSQKLRILDSQGYVGRSKDPLDRRICYVQLTQNGRETATQELHAFLYRVEQALSALGAERTETLLCLISDLSDVMDLQSHMEATKKSEKTEENPA